MIKSIKKAVTKRLKTAFPNVDIYTELIEQGVKLPCFFVEVFPIKFSNAGPFTEKQDITVRLAYCPEHESQDEYIAAMMIIKRIFLYNTLDFDDRHLTCQTIDFDIDGRYLIGVWQYSAYTDPDAGDETDEYEKAETLEFNLTGGN